MRKEEREKLREAIRLLYAENGWEPAMAILLPLAKLYRPMDAILAKAHSITLDELRKKIDADAHATQQVER